MCSSYQWTWMSGSVLCFADSDPWIQWTPSGRAHLFGPYRLEIDRLSVACHPMVSLFSNQTWAYGLLL